MALLSPAKKIAVIELQGVIGKAVRPQLYLPLLERVRRSGRLRALVLAVDSPGGAAAASEELYLGVKKVAAVKPVVAFIRDQGASGAYYISSAAHKIVAIRNGLVGSIGVISARPVAEQLFQKVGVAFSVQKSGEHKDMFGPWRAPTSVEAEKVQGLLAEIYTRFVEVVAQGRNMDSARVQELATGELFTSQRAKELGLVDELGDLDAALDLAASMAGIRRRVLYLRPKRPLFRLLRGGFAQEMAQALVEEVEFGMTGRLWL